MSDTAISLQHKIASAGDLQGVVRTMKAMAASSISQYENAVQSLNAYFYTVQLGLATCLAQSAMPHTVTANGQQANPVISALVFGSDQGLVGQFNDEMAAFVVNTLARQSGPKQVWSIGERVAARLAEGGVTVASRFALPTSIAAVAPLVGQILVALEAQRHLPVHQNGEVTEGAWSPLRARVNGRVLEEVYVFYQGPQAGARHAPVCQRLLPLDAAWCQAQMAIAWPNRSLPEVMPEAERTLHAFIREYLFVSLYRACAASLASENASRLAAMQRAEKNIEERLDEMQRAFHQLRQASIDEELFDVTSGFEALSLPAAPP